MNELDGRTRKEMLSLMQGHFLGVSPERFETDLAGKNLALLINDDQGRLCGFSTMLCHEAEVNGEAVQVIYSGDTIMASHGRAGSALAKTWIRAVNDFRTHGPPNRRWWWLLITSGFRTYRFLPVFWKHFWPRHSRETPSGIQDSMDTLARDRFGDNYDPGTGIVRFGTPQKLLGDLGKIDPGRLRNPDIAFFVERNPGHACGDELVCLCELSEENLTPAGRRIVSSL